MQSVVFCLYIMQKALLEELSGGSAPLRSLRQLGWDLGPQETLALFHEQLSDVVGTNVQMVPMVTQNMFQSAADLVQVGPTSLGSFLCAGLCHVLPTPLQRTPAPLVSLSGLQLIYREWRKVCSTDACGNLSQLQV